MKKTILLIVMLACGITCLMAQKGTEIHFENWTHDFGEVGTSALLKCVFPFTNTGDSVLVISYVRGSCECIKGKCSRDTIKPGETGEIEVIFDKTSTHTMPGPFMRTVMVYNNGINGYERIYVKGKVVDK